MIALNENLRNMGYVITAESYNTEERDLIEYNYHICVICVYEGVCVFLGYKYLFLGIKIVLVASFINREMSGKLCFPNVGKRFIVP